jgi:glycosyltransferase involved in cell wall biosynthesis
MKISPRVSVIIPVYDCERFLAEAIDSVLDQTYPPFETIVVDDGSTDRSADIARSFAPRVRYCYQLNSGIGAARNSGADLANGELLAFLDADDRWVAEKLAKQLAAFENDPELHMVFGQARQLRNGVAWERGIDEKTCHPVGLMPGIVPGTMLIKRASYFRVGPFRTDLKVGEFIDWYSRAVEASLRSLTLPDLVLWRRLHDTNQGIRERQAITDYALVLKASLDRRRMAKRKSADN